MFILCMVFCFITLHNVSAERKFESTSGQNVSFSWTINKNATNDALTIYHGTSFFVWVWLAKKLHIRNDQSDRVLVYVEKFANETLSINVTLLNITKYDAGTYKVLLQRSSEEVSDSVVLEIIGSYDYSTTSMGGKMETDGHIHHTTTLLMQKEDTEEVTDGMTKMRSSKMATEGISHHTTTGFSLKDDQEDSGFPSKRHLLYILLGTGGVLAAAFFACILNIIRIWLRMDSVSKRNRITDSNIDVGVDNMQEENVPGTYWMIVSNERGELSTAIETHLERRSEQLLIEPTLIPTENESREALKPADVKMNEESDEYLTPVHTDPIELDEYIHPVHSGSVHTTTTSIQFINIL